jgi:hypothetical protein
LPDDKRKELASTLIDKSIDVHKMFDTFLHTMRSEHHDISGISDKKIFEYDYLFDRISKTFARIYPNLYTGFENYWYHPRMFWLAIDTYSYKHDECNHKWERQYIFKFGKFYYCRKCRLRKRYEEK